MRCSCARRTPTRRSLSVDTAAAKATPGVIAVLTGADLAADRIGNLICGWMIHSKDGTPMKIGAHPALAHRPGALRRRPGGGGHRRNARSRPRDAAELVEVDYEVLPAVDRSGEGARRRRAAIHDVAPDNLIFDWSSATRPPPTRPSPRPPTSSSSTSSTTAWSPNPMEPRVGDRRLRRGRGALHALHHLAEPARRAARALGLRRHRARAQAPRHRPGRRRRLRLEDLHLPRGDRLPLGLQEGRRPSGQVDLRPQRGLPHRLPTAATTSPTAELALDADHKFLGLRESTRSPTSAPTCRSSRR